MPGTWGLEKSIPKPYCAPYSRWNGPWRAIARPIILNACFCQIDAIKPLGFFLNLFKERFRPWICPKMGKNKSKIELYCLTYVQCRRWFLCKFRPESGWYCTIIWGLLLKNLRGAIGTNQLHSMITKNDQKSIDSGLKNTNPNPRFDDNCLWKINPKISHISLNSRGLLHKIKS